MADAGTIDASTAGAKTVELSTPAAITGGLVYFAVAWQGAAGALRFSRYVQSGGNAYPRVASGVNTVGGVWSFNQNDVSGALPDPWTAGTPAGGTDPVPWMFMRVSGLL